MPEFVNSVMGEMVLARLAIITCMLIYSTAGASPKFHTCISILGIRLTVEIPTKFPKPQKENSLSLMMAAPSLLSGLHDDIFVLVTEIGSNPNMEQNGSLFPISEAMWSDIARRDSLTGFSQVYIGKDGNVIGFILAYYNLQTESIEIKKIGVKLALRKRGIAKVMMASMANRAKLFGVTEIDLLVLDENKLAINVYEKMGFLRSPQLIYQPDALPGVSRYVVSVEKLMDSLNSR